jgi:ribosomal protein L32
VYLTINNCPPTHVKNKGPLLTKINETSPHLNLCLHPHEYAFNHHLSVNVFYSRSQEEHLHVECRVTTRLEALTVPSVRCAVVKFKRLLCDCPLSARHAFSWDSNVRHNRVRTSPVRNTVESVFSLEMIRIIDLHTR